MGAQHNTGRQALRGERRDIARGSVACWDPVPALGLPMEDTALPTTPTPTSSRHRGRSLPHAPLLTTLGGLVVLALLGAPGCEREMLDPVCTPVSPGQLVVTEIRGPQAGVDTYGQWIEIFNTAAAPVSLAGIRFRITKLDGSGEVFFTVRDEGLTIGPTGYVVLGRFPREALPDHVDYGYQEELPGDLPDDGLVELYVCNELIDTVIYRSLPGSGSLAFDGTITPTAAANDDEPSWCNDNVTVGTDPTQVGMPGTPGEPNIPCN